jgi:hypothetical protein
VLVAAATISGAFCATFPGAVPEIVVAKFLVGTRPDVLAGVGLQGGSLSMMTTG